MMTENILSRLFKYNIKTNTPLENFVTEVWTYLLKSDKELLQQFLLESLNVDLSKDGLNDLVVESQTNRNGKFIDIEIYNKDLIIFIENKIDARCTTKQLVDYRTILRSLPFKKRFLLVIHRDFLPTLNLTNDDVTIKQMRWYQIYHIIKKFQSEKYNVNFTIKEFSNFLEEKNMVIQKYTSEDTKIWSEYNNLHNRISNTLKQISQHLKSSGLSKGFKIDEFEDVDDIFFALKKGKLFILIVGFHQDYGLYVGVESKLNKKEFSKKKEKIIRYFTKNNYLYKYDFAEEFFFKYMSFKDISNLDVGMQEKNILEFIEQNLKKAINDVKGFKL